MTDREKVIKGLECCIGSDNGDCPIDCPFYDECFSTSGSNPFVPAMRAALQVLKKQKAEPKTVLMRVDGNYCPHCSSITTRAMGVQRLIRGTRFCPYCGKPVKWYE